MISNKQLKKNSNFVFISTMKKFVHVQTFKKNLFKDLVGIEEQKKILLTNTKAFLNNKLYNNALLWGSKGMGKSSLIFAVHEYFINLKKKTKLLEILSTDIIYLPEIIYNLHKFDEKFIIFIDDIVLDTNKEDFRVFKVTVEGSMLSHSNNIAFYITSNNRHIIKPVMDKNLNDIQIKDQKANSISLSDRFGLWIGFHKCSKQQYLKIVELYANKYKLTLPRKTIEKLAMEWSIQKGDFSGRIAFQFITNIISN